MSLGNFKEMLADARAKGYGIPAYNNLNYETMKYIIDAATETRQPVILMLYPGMQNYIPMDDFVALARHLASKTPVPVGIHLDHSYNIDELYAAMRAGFQSVMYDCSKLPNAENASKLAALMKVARPMGVDVEAELGHVGSGAIREDFKNTDHFTKPGDVVKFLEDAQVDALAVAIGNSHGVYIETPNLDIPLLHNLNTLSKVPLVMHGTSLIPDDQVQAAILGGITKVNLFTEFVGEFTASIHKQVAADSKVGYMKIISESHKTVMEYLLAKFRLLNPKGVKVV